ncbi:conserved hypothetical protein [Ricinus communis]|uniref:Uncharacterized protein n=1 Tax=Ricinus communis TaxID=3988 RepID=B9SBB8_RICCO|nr:conserved hypothetical protein [Ricinus communis]
MDLDELSWICAKLQLADNPNSTTVTVDAKGLSEAKAWIGVMEEVDVNQSGACFGRYLHVQS